jgi:trans-AT polyketide synthase/acyltransferase/oxidoreductase domain-containing protein
MNRGLRLMKYGHCLPKENSYTFHSKMFKNLIFDIRKPLHIIHDPKVNLMGLSTEGEITSNEPNSFKLLGSFPAMYPEWLGDRSFS